MPAIDTVGRCGAHAGSVLHLPGIHTYMQSQIQQPPSSHTPYNPPDNQQPGEGRHRLGQSYQVTIQWKLSIAQTKWYLVPALQQLFAS